RYLLKLMLFDLPHVIHNYPRTHRGQSAIPVLRPGRDPKPVHLAEGDFDVPNRGSLCCCLEL
nr:hypothetical protein [Candidatus Sigynarchaeota archaeon]